MLIVAHKNFELPKMKNYYPILVGP
ncbi:hypothetical protein, partial [Lactococcus hircilactis]